MTALSLILRVMSLIFTHILSTDGADTSDSIIIYLVDIHTIILSKINCFRHQAFVHIHILSLSKMSLVFV